MCYIEFFAFANNVDDNIGIVKSTANLEMTDISNECTGFVVYRLLLNTSVICPMT
jgi:hypothetical protein